MKTFKETVVEICSEVAEEFSGWKFQGGEFRRSVFKKCDIAISGGFSYNSISTVFQPLVLLHHKPTMSLYKKIIGISHPTSFLEFKSIEGFHGKVKPLWNIGLILKNKTEFFRAAPEANKNADRYIDVSEVRPVIHAMVQDGISLLDQYYNQTSEINILTSLPPKYEPHYSHDKPPGLNGALGIAACIAHIYVGDFEFFNWYRSDACETVLPKKVADLEKIALALPELKKMFGRAAG